MNVQYTQPGYFDLGEEAARIQISHRHQRRRLLGIFRGYLRETASPHQTVATLFAGACLVSASLCSTICYCGFRHPAALGLLFFVAAWPVFLFLLHRHAGLVFQRLRLDRDLAHFIRHDETAQAMENAPASPATQRRRQELYESCVREFNRQGCAVQCLPVILILALATIGISLVYTLFRSGPQLIAQMLLDAHYIPAHPNLYRRVESGSWLREAAGGTAVHFLGLAVVSLIIVADVNLLVDRYRPKPAPEMPALPQPSQRSRPSRHSATAT